MFRRITKFTFNICLVLAGSLIFSSTYLSSGPFIALGIILFIFILVVSLRNIKLTFYFLFIWLMAEGILTNLTFLGRVSVLKYIDEILVSVLICYLVINIGRLKLKYRISKVVFAMLLFSFFSALSGIFNKSEPVLVVNYIFTYMKPFIIFVSSFLLLSREENKKLIYFMLATMIVQFLVANIQLFSYGRGNFLVGPEIGGLSGWVDSARGLFGEYGSHKLGNYSVIFLVLSTSARLFTVQRKWIFWIFICSYTFIITLTEQDYIFLFIFLIIVSNVLLTKRVSLLIPRLTILFSAILLLLISLFLIAQCSSLFTSRYKEYFTDSRKLSSIGKVQSLLLTKDILSTEPIYTLIGVGPGNFSGGIAGKGSGEFYKKYIGFRVKNVSSTLDYWWSSFITLIGEVGLTGYLLYMFLYGILMSVGLKMIRNKEYKVTGFDRGAAFALCNLIFFVIFMSFLSNQLEWLSLMFPIAIIASYVWQSYYFMRDSNTLNG